MGSRTQAKSWVKRKITLAKRCRDHWPLQRFVKSNKQDQWRAGQRTRTGFSESKGHPDSRWAFQIRPWRFENRNWIMYIHPKSTKWRLARASHVHTQAVERFFLPNNALIIAKVATWHPLNGYRKFEIIMLEPCQQRYTNWIKIWPKSWKVRLQGRQHQRGPNRDAKEIR